MGDATLLQRARLRAGLSQEEAARRGRTSRPTLSAYEHGRKSPTLETTQRVLAGLGFDLIAEPSITFVEHVTARGPVSVPNVLPRLSAPGAFAVVRLPLALNWSEPERLFDLRSRRERSRVYEIVLREGGPDDVLAYIDGLLLIDLWSELVLPKEVRAAWEPLISSALQGREGVVQ
ncbi:MAG TPA: helix-turn-helix transcriptional regulator [Actinomycetota bacterium]|mgnify:CR=1 FL=1|jgi:transcriptional regulator with XRE-family HTH domain|nr:helix-turn-helix transcriptional regulator [Phycicoccus sp.]HQZ86960.1 helix-turn-helix transcriptional regulator [Actinomycetota bacterium]